MYKIAIAGASTLVGRELKEALSESPLATANFVGGNAVEAVGMSGNASEIGLGEHVAVRGLPGRLHLGAGSVGPDVSARGGIGAGCGSRAGKGSHADELRGTRQDS